jgi:hypothetical protein
MKICIPTPIRARVLIEEDIDALQWSKFDDYDKKQ